MPIDQQQTSAAGAARTRDVQLLTDQELERMFSYQELSGSAASHFAEIRASALKTARLIQQYCPQRTETLESIRDLQSGVNWAHTSMNLGSASNPQTAA